jgi:hypothetical protein
LNLSIPVFFRGFIHGFVKTVEEAACQSGSSAWWQFERLVENLI